MALAALLALPAQAASVLIEARDNVFAPKSRTVAVGDRITWRNSGAVAHEVTANNGAFSSGNIAPGASYSWTATGSGTVGYYCRYHGTATSGMTGSVTLTTAAAPSSGHPRTGGGRERQAGLLVLVAVTATGVVLRRGRPAAGAAR
jgi:plastocyanin